MLPNPGGEDGRLERSAVGSTLCRRQLIQASFSPINRACGASRASRGRGEGTDGLFADIRRYV
jgi:hypothetical protein